MDNAQNISEIRNTVDILKLDSIGLTKDYVYKKFQKFGFEYSNYIFIKDISSIEITSKTHPVLLIIAVIALIFVVYAKNYYYIMQTQSNFLWIVPIIFLSAYFFTKRNLLCITSCGGTQLKYVISWYKNGDDVKMLVENIINIKKQLN